MARGIDFSLELDDINAPASPNGQLLVAAGAAEGKAHAAEGAADVAKEAAQGQLLTFLGTQAVEGVKGKMSADLEGEIKSEIAKFTEAHRQGLASREETIANIGASVKKYSAMMPGWASEFRKVAADATGISNVDTYGIHQALITKSLAEKRREAIEAADVQLTKEIASAFGLSSLSEVTPLMKANYASMKQAQAKTAHMEAVKKQTDITQDEADRLNEGLANGHISAAIGSMNARLTQLHAAQLNASGPLKADEAIRLGHQVSAEFQTVKAQLIQKFNQMTIGKNAMSRKRADELIANVSKMMDDYSEFVKSADGMNLWKSRLEQAKGNVQGMLNLFMQDHPNVMLWKELGVARDYVQAWTALNGDKEAFARVHGKVAADTMERISKKGMAGYNDAFRRVATGQTTITEEHDPDHRSMILNDVTRILERALQDPSSLPDNAKESVANLSGSWIDAIDITKPADLDKFASIMTDRRTVDLLSTLDQEQRFKALTPFFEKVNRTLGNTQKDVADRVKLLNELPANKDKGHKVEVVLDPLTQRLRLKVTEGQPPKEMRVSKNFSVPTNALQARGFKFGVDLETREAMRMLEQRVKWLNTAPRALANVAPLVNPERKVVVEALMGDILSGAKGGQVADILVPRNADDLDRPRMSADLKEDPAEAEARIVAAAEIRRKESSPEELQRLFDANKTVLSQRGLNADLRRMIEADQRIIEKALGQ